MTLSIIIPCLNDAAALRECLARLQPRPSGTEVIVADASEGAECARVAQTFDALLVRCQPPGRGRQLNAGAGAAKGEVFLFNHADTALELAHLENLLGCLHRGVDFLGGAFYRDIAWQYPAFRRAAPLARLYLRNFGILFGDQSVFVRREHFHALGGFPDIPIMEDVEFSRRLRRHGKLLFLTPPLRTSMRRFQRRGYLKNKLQNVGILWLYRMRLLTPDQIYRWYYRR